MSRVSLCDDRIGGCDQCLIRHKLSRGKSFVTAIFSFSLDGPWRKTGYFLLYVKSYRHYFILILFSRLVCLGCITLSDLKNCKLAYIFFNTFFNLDKYLEYEQRDPFAAVRVRNHLGLLFLPVAYLTDWMIKTNCHLLVVENLTT